MLALMRYGLFNSTSLLLTAVINLNYYHMYEI